ncbi:MAG: carboxylesterase [Coxiella sp. RIFCSPHIGHO2_12_FULL_44_14]|nr:MAG: carboxylesterase [Coxiella sp. RIFCSPHIGHO2_12_FULL_44_14]
MKNIALESVIIEPAQPAKSSIIWLHGLGADGHDFVDIVPQLHLPSTLDLRFIFPHAPLRLLTSHNMRLRAWYDFDSLTDFTAKEDLPGILEAQQVIYQLISQEITHGIPSQQIILAGFSQGGALALCAGLCYEKPLAGILSLSAYLPLADTVSTRARKENSQTPILMAHGRFDTLLPMTLGYQSYLLLKKWGHPVEWKEYPMEHQVCQEEIKDIQQWLITYLQHSTQTV